METITRFTLVCHDTADADALHAVFGSPAGAPLEAALQAFFAARKRAIHPPDGMGFDHYQRMGLVIDAAFTSGSADAADFLQPLARAYRALHAEMVDDEVARRREYGFIDGQKKPPAYVAALMRTLAPASQLGRVGRMAEAAARAASDPTAGLVRAIGTSKNAATVAALLAQGADPNSFCWTRAPAPAACRTWPICWSSRPERSMRFSRTWTASSPFSSGWRGTRRCTRSWWRTGSG